MLQLQNHFCAILLSLMLIGCTVGPDFQSPKPPQTTSFTSSIMPQHTVAMKDDQNKSQEFVVQQQITKEWWKLFHCEKLNKLINRGLQNSPSLQGALAALRQAEENLKGGMGGFFPTLDAQVAASRQKESQAAFGSNGPTVLFNLYNANLNVSYSPDIFGALSRQVEALGAEVDHKQFELEAAYLTLTANIVTTALKAASLRAQINTTHEIINTQEEQLKISQSQFKMGGTSQSDVLSQETQVAQLRATLPPLLSSLAQAQHALAILIGDLPSEADIPSLTLEEIELPRHLPMTVPSHLIQHRPDIKAADALLHIANAQIGIAKANMFPQLTLTGSIGDLNNKYRNLFTSSSDVWSVTSQLLQPIFHGGTLIAKENAAIAAYDQTFAQYKITVLQSFQQVADVLQALVEDAKTHKAFLEAEQSALHALEISEKQYKLGALSLLNLLTVERQYLQARLGRIKAEATRYIDTAALFQALGGDRFPENQARYQTSKYSNACPEESLS